jgi:hypothetical protein
LSADYKQQPLEEPQEKRAKTSHSFNNRKHFNEEGNTASIEEIKKNKMKRSYRPPVSDLNTNFGPRSFEEPSPRDTR